MSLWSVSELGWFLRTARHHCIFEIEGISWKSVCPPSPAMNTHRLTVTELEQWLISIFTAPWPDFLPASAGWSPLRAHSSHLYCIARGRQGNTGKNICFGATLSYFVSRNAVCIRGQSSYTHLFLINHHRVLCPHCSNEHSFNYFKILCSQNVSLYFLLLIFFLSVLIKPFCSQFSGVWEVNCPKEKSTCFWSRLLCVLKSYLQFSKSRGKNSNNQKKNKTNEEILRFHWNNCIRSKPQWNLSRSKYSTHGAKEDTRQVSTGMRDLANGWRLSMVPVGIIPFCW